MAIELNQEGITDVSGLGIFSYPLSGIDELSVFLRDNSLSMTEDCFISFCRSIKVPVNFYRNQNSEVKPKLLDNQKKFLTEFSSILFVKDNDDLVYAGLRTAAFSQTVLSNFTNLPEFLNYRFSLEGLNFKNGYYRLYIHSAKEGSPSSVWSRCYILDIPMLRNKPIFCYEGYYNELTLACVSSFSKDVTHVYDISKKYSDRVNSFQTLLSLRDFFESSSFLGVLYGVGIIFESMLLDLKKGKFISKSLYESILDWYNDTSLDESVPIKEVVKGIHAMEVIVYFIDTRLALHKRGSAKRKLMMGLNKLL